MTYKDAGLSNKPVFGADIVREGLSNDPRGTLRKWTHITQTPRETLIWFECGHIGSFNPIFDYSCDKEHRCFACRKRGN